MPSPPNLEIETLLAPIAGANPAGEPLPFEVRKKLDDSRKEVNPEQFARNDPRRPEQPQPADWAGIEQLTQDTLKRTTKDLLVGARLMEALVKRRGFSGLRDGLRVMRRLVNDCWDRIYPVVEDGDLDARAAPLLWLDDEIRGARFPNTLRTVPLTNPNARAGEDSDGARFGWQNWKAAQSQDARGEVTPEAFDQAVVATPREYCQGVADDLAECVKELMELGEVLTAKMGDAAPGLSQVRKAVLDCQELAQHILKRKGPAPVSSQDANTHAAEPESASQSAGPQGARRPVSREDVLARLADASAMLLQMEPHSPIAYLVQRAVKLAKLPLPDLMKILVRDPGVLGQLDRDLDLGIEEATKAAKSK